MKADIIIITSGKGGAGKTTVSACLAKELASMGKKTLLLELDMGLRSLDIILSVQNKVVYDVFDVISGRCDAEKAIINIDNCPNLDLICASINPEVQLNKNQLQALCTALLTRYDHIIIDTPAGLGAGFKSAAAVCDLALIVVTPDPVCVRDGAFISSVLEEEGVKSQRLIINRLNGNFLKNKVIFDLDEVIDTIGVQLIGVVPESKYIYRLNVSGEPLPAESSASRVYKRIAKRLFGIDLPLYIRSV